MNLHSLLLRHFENVRDATNAYRVNCPFCESRGEKRNDKKGRLYFYEDGFAYCFNCQIHLPALKAIAKVSGRDLPSLTAEIGGAIKKSDRLSRSTRRAVAVSEEASRVESLKLSKIGYSYLRNERGISLEAIKRSGARSDDTNVYFPLFDVREPIMVYWQSRSIGQKRFENPGLFDGVMPKQNHLYQIWSARWFSHWIIVESILDALVVGPQAVALLGSSMSEEQLAWVAHYRPREVTVFLDADCSEEKIVKVGNKIDRLGILATVAVCKDDPANDGLGTVKRSLFARKNFF